MAIVNPIYVGGGSAPKNCYWGEVPSGQFSFSSSSLLTTRTSNGVTASIDTTQSVPVVNLSGTATATVNGAFAIYPYPNDNTNAVAVQKGVYILADILSPSLASNIIRTRQWGFDKAEQQNFGNTGKYAMTSDKSVVANIDFGLYNGVDYTGMVWKPALYRVEDLSDVEF